MPLAQCIGTDLGAAAFSLVLPWDWAFLIGAIVGCVLAFTPRYANREGALRASGRWTRAGYLGEMSGVRAAL